MFETLYGFLLTITLPLNFLNCVILFVGSLYVTLHCRTLPNWLVTPLWYTGVSAFLISVTIVLQWFLGKEFSLSYYNVGLFGELLLNTSLAVTIGLLFVNTVKKDIDGAKNRRTAGRKGKVKK